MSNKILLTKILMLIKENMKLINIIKFKSLN